jgi:hypothetical protein
MQKLGIRFFAVGSLFFSSSVALAIREMPDGYPQREIDRSFEMGIKVLRPKLVSSEQDAHRGLVKRNGRALVDAKTGVLRLIESPRSMQDLQLSRKSTLSEYEAAARKAVSTHARILGLVSMDLVLDQKAVLQNEKEVFLKFRLYSNGLAIQDALIDVRFKQGRLVQIINQAFSEASSDLRQSQPNLKQMLSNRLPLDHLRQSRHLIRVRETKTGYEQIRVQEFIAQMGGQNYEIQVEEATGDIFQMVPSKVHMQGVVSAQLHDRTWQETLVEQPIKELYVKHEQGKVLSDLNGLFAIATGLTPRLEGYVGPRIEVVTVTGATAKTVAKQHNGRWEIFHGKEGLAEAYEDKDVAQAMVFQHVLSMIDHAKNYIDTPWFRASLRARVNLPDNCNAHWDRLDGTINFYSAGQDSGTHCANTGLISDVVFHEWGHGLDDNTGGIEDGAFSEGFGDICSMLMTRSPILGPGFTVNGGHVRELATDKVYPRDRGNGVHAEGLIIGSTFYNLFQAFENKFGQERAVDIVSNFAFKAIVAASKYTDVYDALLVIDDDDGDLSNGTPHYCLINEIFSLHGLAFPNQACHIARIDTLHIDDRLGNANGIFEPGEEVHVSVPLTSFAGESFSDVSAEVRILTPVAGVQLENANLQWDPLQPGQSVFSSTTFTLKAEASAACGAEIPLHFTLNHEDRQSEQKRNIRLGRLSGLPEWYEAASMPRPIPDKGEVVIRQLVDGRAWQNTDRLHALRLRLRISHSYIGDLSIQLTSPKGKSLVLFEGRGSGKLIELDSNLSAYFQNEVAKGEWKLTVKDRFASDVGTVEVFALEVTPSTYECL